MGEMLDVVISLKLLASHPLLLPVALYWVSSQMLRHDNNDVHKIMKQVQIDTGLLKTYLNKDSKRASAEIAKKTDAELPKQPPTLTQIHQTIVKQHAQLTRGLAEFTEELGKSCLLALDEIEELGEENDKGQNLPTWLDEDAHSELRTLVAHTEVSTKYELHHRRQMLSRVDIQLQVLYNLMQSRIGDKTLRNSSAMKSIAVLTMVFLPSTALATIFSMSSFFSQSPKTTHIVVSSEFWIFWAVAAPITLVVLISFFMWIQRRELYKWWRGNQDKDVKA